MSGPPHHDGADCPLLDGRGQSVSLEGSQKENVEELKTSSCTRKAKDDETVVVGAVILQPFIQAIQLITASPELQFGRLHANPC